MSLEELRKKIDTLDENIIQLLSRRASIAVDIAKIKAQAGMKSFYDPVREKQVYNRITDLNQGPLPDKALQSIYKEVMSATLALEQPLQVAYLGPQTTFTHMACLQHFGNGASLLPCDSIDSVFSMVEKRRADYGVVPVENSTEGVVNHTLDRFVDSDLAICGELFVEVTHHLLSTTDIEKVTKLYIHPQTEAQCRTWLRKNLPGIELCEVYSNARAAECAAADSCSAAVAGKLAANHFGLNILAEHIEDSSSNRTRFLVISHTPLTEASGRDKTSIIFSVRHQAGALYKALHPFERHAVNMTMIESRPTKKRPWEYIFFIDVQGHHTYPDIVESLKEMKEHALFIKILGSYPEAD